jgi:hypothetical protein
MTILLRGHVFLAELLRANRIVIPTGAKRSGGTCGFFSSDRCCGPQRLYPLSSRPERSVVERSAVLSPGPLLRTTTPLPIVISTGAKRSGGTCGFFAPDRCCVLQRLYPLSSRPERSAVEISAVSLPRTAAADYNASTLCHLDRSEAQWRDLRFFPPVLTHPLKSYAADHLYGRGTTWPLHILGQVDISS